MLKINKMNIEIKDLMDDNEMLSHIFLGCIEQKDLRKIKDNLKEGDWRKESITIPVEMKIGGIDVNPKEFFDNWKDQMQKLILKRATKLVAENGSKKMLKMQEKMEEMEQVMKSWENDINWEVENPLI